MEDILTKARRLGIDFGDDIYRQVELQETLFQAERERESMEEAGESTVVHNAVIKKLREEIDRISAQLN
jgi:hypothetical protein